MAKEEDYERASLEAQRRAFEAQFGSLEDMGFEDKTKHTEVSVSSDESFEANDDEDLDLFTGFDDENRDEDAASSSDDDERYHDLVSSEDEAPQVVKLTEEYTPHLRRTLTAASGSSKREKRLLMLGKAPTLAEIEKREKMAAEQLAKQLRKQGGDDPENLQNDIELNRLLQESHILANKLEHSGAELTLQTIDYENPTGNARARILDHRMRKAAELNLSSNGLPKKLEKMPMSMRKGMIKAREARVAKYEEEAREAGIVLSKVRKGQLRDLNAGKGTTASSDRLGTGIPKKKPSKRDYGLKINNVGKVTRNGVHVSEREIARINDSDMRGSKGRRGGKGGRRGKF